MNALIEGQRIHGRQDMSTEFINKWGEQHSFALQILDDERRSRHVRILAEFLRDATASITHRQTTAKPTYYVYADVQILDWFINQRRGRLVDLKTRCLEGIFYLLRDVLDFESRSLTGIEVHSSKKMVPRVLHERIECLRAVIEETQCVYTNIVGEQYSWKYPLIEYNSMEEYVIEEPRISGLCKFSCFPQTEFHDEVIFIRTIHIAEFCFWGLRLGVVEALEHIKRSNNLIAEQVLAQANGFAQILHLTFVLLKTMPASHFADFREATGNASAVQSRAYQLMEVYFFGVDARKLTVFEKDRNLKSLKKFYHPEFITLKTALGRLQSDPVTWKGTIDQARVLDKQLLSWRGLHLAFAKSYLPQSAESGTGGTAGAAYLRQYLRNNLFEDTQVDFDVIQLVFPDLPEIRDLFRVQPGTSIAPE